MAPKRARLVSAADAGKAAATGAAVGAEAAASRPTKKAKKAACASDEGKGEPPPKEYSTNWSATECCVSASPTCVSLPPLLSR